MIDQNDSYPLSVTTTDSSGAPANPTGISVTVTLPDGTTTTPTVTTNPVGTHTAAGPTSQAGHYTVAWAATGANLSAYADSYNVESSAWRGIVSLADVRAHLNVTDTTADEELRPHVLSATDFIESKVGAVIRRTIVETVYPQSNLLFLSGPAISLSTMTAAYGYAATYDVATMFLDGAAGIVHPAYGATFVSPVTVTYVGGRVIVPALIRQAALDYVKWSWETQRGAGGEPQFEATQLETVAPATVPYRITQALEPYMIPVVA